ncbi:MAG: HEAT repeat domain-containing protein [bacterium]
MTSRAAVLLCDRCGARYSIAALPRGGRFRCRNCGKAFQIELDEIEPKTRDVRRAAVKAGLEPLTASLTEALANDEPREASHTAPPAPTATPIPSAAEESGGTGAAPPPDPDAPEPASAHDDEPAPEPVAGTEPATGDAPLFGRYTIEGELGRGEMGVAYRARERATGRAVALKTLLPGVSLGREGSLRFGREARAIQRLDLPGLVPLLDHGESYDTRYLVSELASGTTLDRQPASSYADAKVAVRLVLSLARTVSEAHRQGVLHLDIKPSNVIIDADGTPRLMDVGLTRSVHTPEEHAYQSPTDEVGGRTLYRAPEQLTGNAEGIDARTDVWALGALLYELLTGVPAFSGGTRHDTVREVLEEDPKPPSQIDPELGPALDLVIAKALEKRPRDRYESAERFADDLECWLAGKPVTARPPHWTRRLARRVARNRRRIVGTAATATALALAALAALFWFRDPLTSIRADAASPRATARADALVRGFGLLETGRLDPAARIAMIGLAVSAVDDPSDAVRRVALERLVRQPAAVPDDGGERRGTLERALASCLSTHRTAEVRELAFRAVEVFGVHSAAPTLLALASDPETPAPVAEHAVRVLGQVAGDDAIVGLMRLVGRGGGFRVDAMRAISRIVERSAPTETAATPSAGGIERGRGSRERGPDRVVAAVLGAIQAPAGEDPVLFALRSGGTDAKLRVMWVLARTRDPRTPTLLAELFSDDDPVVARAAAAILVEFGGPVVERKLEAALASESSRVRGNAAFALGELAHPDALDGLLGTFFRETDPGARADLARALGKIGQRGAMPHLIRALDDPNAEVRKQAHAALVTIAKEDAGATSTAWQEWWDTH